MSTAEPNYLQRFFTVIILLPLLVAGLYAQEPAPPEPTDEPNLPSHVDMRPVTPRTVTGASKFKLTGRVVNSVTGEGVARAVVMLDELFGTMTDSNGDFEFNGVVQGSHSVTAKRPGYFGKVAEDEEERYEEPNVEVSEANLPLILKLIPEAIITGRALDNEGMPIRELQVHLAKREVKDGHASWEHIRKVLADDKGRYRISGIKPGRYLLIGGPTGSFSARARVGGNSGAYPATYFGNSTTGIRIRAGERLQADFNVRPEVTFKVEGDVIGPGSKSVMVIPVNPGQEPKQAPMEGDHFHVSMATKGSYIIHAESEDNGQLYDTVVTLKVDKDITDLKVNLERVPTIQVELSKELEAKPGNNFAEKHILETAIALTLLPADRFRTEVYLSRDSANVAPGKYRLQNYLDGTSYLAAARYGSTDLLREDLVVSASSTNLPLQLFVRDDGAMISVKVQGGRASRLLVIPDEGRPFEASLWKEADSDFQVGQLRPGSYRFLAFDDLEDLAYDDPKELESFLSQAVRVDLSAKQHARVTLPLIKREEE